jgi:molybdopterin-guanine dinucleotide biosynthesis protein
VVLVEGFKHGPLPRIEIFRRGVHAHPVHEPGSPEVLAFVTDDLDLEMRAASAGSAVIPLDHAGTHVDARGALIERSVIGRHAR